MIDTVLFDLDGTICNTNDLIYESFKYTLKENFNINENRDIIYSFFGEPLEKSFSRYTKDENEVRYLVNFYREFNEKNHDKMIKDFPRVEETLDILKEMNIKLGIVTSKRKKMAMRSLTSLNIDKYFTAFVTPESTKLHKPNPDPVIKALNILDSKYDKAIMVGDSMYDIVSGRRAGVYTCGVEYSLLKRQLLESKPDYMVKDLYGIVDIIKK